MENTLTLSTECFDEAMNYLIAEYGLFSIPVNTFFQLDRTDKAIQYACSLGFDIQD